MSVLRAVSGTRHAAAGWRARRRRCLGFGVGASALVAMSGCASLGTNVKGSFACSAPDGICAPTSTIDDQALAMLQGDTPVTPAGPYDQPTRPQGLVRASAGGLARTQDKIVRIVFPPHVDAHGRYHEKTAVHAVVQPGAWSHDVVAARSAAAPEVSQARTMPSLGELAAAAPEVAYPAAEGAQEVAAVDLSTPDPAIVAAARARAVKGSSRGRKGGAYRSRSASVIVAPPTTAYIPAPPPFPAATPQAPVTRTASASRPPVTPDEIRAAVAARLAPRRASTSTAVASTATALALPFAATAAQVQPTALPIAGAPTSMPAPSAIAPTAAPKVTNSPAFFPAGDAVRNNK